MIVDFAVEDYDRIAVVTKERLIPIFEVDDFQAHGAQSGRASFKHPLLIRSPMCQELINSLGDTPPARRTPARKTRNSAHYKPVPVPLSWRFAEIHLSMVCQEYNILLVNVRTILERVGRLAPLINWRRLPWVNRILPALWTPSARAE